MQNSHLGQENGDSLSKMRTKVQKIAQQGKAECIYFNFLPYLLLYSCLYEGF